MIARLPLIALAATLAACTHLATAEPPATDALPDMADMPGPADGVFPSMMRQTADIQGADGAMIGSANLLSGPNGMMIRVEIAPGGLTPGWHGMHLHAVGDCSDIGTYTLSGGHVGKHEGGHGLLNPKGPEAGDLPNIWAAADGSAGYEAFSTMDALAGLADADGTAIIIHESEDDHLTQPIGGAGARVACGVVK